MTTIPTLQDDQQGVQVHYDNISDITGKYEIVIRDDPWLYYGSKTKPQAAGKHYDCIADEVLMREFNPSPFMAKRSVLFMWVTSSTVMRAGKLLENWGLYYRGIAFNWIKTTKDGRIIGAQGSRPSITKPTTEYVIVASTLERGRPLPLADESIVQNVCAWNEEFIEGDDVLAPRRGHSQKPDEVQVRIERLFAQPVRRLEMFARRPRAGWDTFGNAVVATS